MASDDPDLAKTAADVIGLYLRACLKAQSGEGEAPDEP
jgi:hypothetical protein